MLSRVPDGLNRVYILHRDRHSYMGDVHLGTLVRCWYGCEDLMYLLKRVLCWDKVNGHLGRYWSRIGSL